MSALPVMPPRRGSYAEAVPGLRPRSLPVPVPPQSVTHPCTTLYGETALRTVLANHSVCSADTLLPLSCRGGSLGTASSPEPYPLMHHSFRASLLR